MNIALAGNPNSGKTSLFNELTGGNQYVGNWPGVTVEKKTGTLREHPEVELVDLPGIYSLAPYSPEEVVTRQYLTEGKPDLIVNVVDATNAERNLYLTSQLIETGIPVIIALNMIDLAQERGDKVYPAALAKALGCPVVAVSALKQTGLAELRRLMVAPLPKPAKPLHLRPELEEALTSVRQLTLCDHRRALLLLEGDPEETARLNHEQANAVDTLRLHLEKACGDDAVSLIAGSRYDAIGALLPAVIEKAPAGRDFSRRVDALLTHRVFGLLIFVAVMWCIYYLSIETIGTWGTDWANDVLFGSIMGDWLGGFIGSAPAGIESMLIISSVVGMSLLFPPTLRRLHDVGLNGSWLYLALAPFVLEYICPHGPDWLHTGLLWLLMGANALLLLICLSFPGHRSANAYGDSTQRFCRNPFRLSGRSGRTEFAVWFVILSAVSFGIGLLGRAQLACSEQVSSLISNGIVAGVGAVLGFLPQMAVLFLLLSLLEDCGYMSRVAFMMDRIFRTIGLSGKSFIPLLVGMGCGVPGIMATRTIENEKDRRMSVMLTTFVPCSAKIPVIALVAALLGGDANTATIAYCAGFGSVIISGFMLRKTHLFRGGYTPFVMELPPYHRPAAANINLRTMERCQAFVKKAGTIIFLASAAVWFLGNYNTHLQYLGADTEGNEQAVEQSMLADVGQNLAPLFAPLGWGEWRPAVAAVSGLIAKENVVGTLGVLYARNTPAEAAEGEPDAPEEEGAESPARTSNLPKCNAFTALTLGLWLSDPQTTAPLTEPAEEEEEEDEEAECRGIAADLRAAKAFDGLSAMSFLLFNLLCAPCFAACGAIRREMNSARWTAFALGYQCAWAYIVAFLTYSIGSLCTGGGFGTAQTVACALALGLLCLIFRPMPHTKS